LLPPEKPLGGGKQYQSYDESLSESNFSLLLDLIKKTRIIRLPNVRRRK